MARTKENEDPEKFARQLAAMEKIRQLPTVDTSDAVELKDRLHRFFNFCAKNDLKPGLELLASYLGTDRKTLERWSHEGDERGHLIAGAVQTVSAMLEQWGLNGDITPTVQIWLQKNWFGYQDQSVLQVERKDPYAELTSAEEIMRRIAKTDSTDNVIDAEFTEADE